ncbi:MAG: pyridoxamine 5'-phosphate oxidase family protein [Gammaproteobacteria bacterium]|nr:pyridoxamine 5'-phosphate oxidase family protein [Gammaproteobacteria bacterium]
MHQALQSNVAQELLNSRLPARLAFVGANGDPHVTPIWFEWQNPDIVVCARADSFKVKAIRQHPRIALTIDTEQSPYKSLRIRGTAQVELADGVLDEYVRCAHRYYGEGTGQRWIDWFATVTVSMARITISPHWVEVLDFRERFAHVYDE